MNNIQKSFKAKGLKAAKQGIGLRAGGKYADGLLPEDKPETPEQFRARQWSAASESSRMDSLTGAANADIGMAVNRGAYGGRIQRRTALAQQQKDIASRSLDAFNSVQPKALPEAPGSGPTIMGSSTLPGVAMQQAQERSDQQLVSGGRYADGFIGQAQNVLRGRHAQIEAAVNGSIQPASYTPPAPAQVAQSKSYDQLDADIAAARAKMNKPKNFLGFRNGAVIPGHDTTGRDDVDVKVTRGEAILPVKTVDAMGGPGVVGRLIHNTNGKPPAGMGIGGKYAVGMVDDKKRKPAYNPYENASIIGMVDAAKGIAAPLIPNVPPLFNAQAQQNIDAARSVGGAPAAIGTGIRETLSSAGNKLTGALNKSGEITRNTGTMIEGAVRPVVAPVVNAAATAATGDAIPAMSAQIKPSVVQSAPSAPVAAQNPITTPAATPQSEGIISGYARQQSGDANMPARDPQAPVSDARLTALGVRGDWNKMTEAAGNPIKDAEIYATGKGSRGQANNFAGYGTQDPAKQAADVAAADAAHSKTMEMYERESIARLGTRIAQARLQGEDAYADTLEKQQMNNAALATVGAKAKAELASAEGIGALRTAQAGAAGAQTEQAKMGIAQQKQMDDLFIKYDDPATSDAERIKIADKIRLMKGTEKKDNNAQVMTAYAHYLKAHNDDISEGKGKPLSPGEFAGAFAPQHPQSLPKGMVKQVGTSGGKPVFVDAQGKQHIGA